jgi:putative redox protein
MAMTVTFTGGQGVSAHYEGLTIDTDQDGSKPAPFDLFLASLATCAGFYALAFMQQRGIDDSGSELTMDWQRDPETRLIATIRIRLRLPDGFPEKYRDAILRAMDQCAVKRHLDKAPAIEATLA